MLWRGRAWLLSFLQLLLLLGMSSLQLLCLLLMPLFHLLLPAFIRVLSCELLMFFLLPLLKVLPVLVLPREQLLLLFLIFLVLLGIPCIWRTWPRNRRQLVRVHRTRSTRIVPRPCILSTRIPRACIPATLIVNGTRLSRLHHSAFVKCSRSRSGSNGRLATVYGRA